MKTTQTESQITLKSSGLGSFIMGVIFIVLGVVLAVVMRNWVDTSGKKPPGWVAIVGLGFAFVGLLFVFFAKNRTTIIQKGGNTTVTAKRFLPIGGAQQQSIATADIVAVRLNTYADNTGSGDSAGSRRSNLMLLLKNNDLVEVGDSGGKGGFSINGMNVSSLIMKAPLSKEANQIATFLGVPLQADDTSSFAGAVRSLKTAFQQNDPSQTPTQTTSFNPQVAAPSSSPTPPAAATPQLAPTPPAAPVPSQPSAPPNPLASPVGPPSQPNSPENPPTPPPFTPTPPSPPQ